MKHRALATMIAFAVSAAGTNIARAQQPSGDTATSPPPPPPPPSPPPPTVSTQDQAAAEGLFTDAKKLMAEGKYDEACPKLEESQRLDPAPGTEFNLGDCYEHIGKTASAWVLFLNVAQAAKVAKIQNREKMARDRAAALEPKLAKLTILVPTPTPNMEVKRDGVVVGQPQWGMAVSIDPGKHTIVASAPSKETYQSVIDVATEAKLTVSIPTLVDSVVTPTTKTIEPRPNEGGLGTQKTLALVAGGVGVLGVGIGSIFGLKGISNLSDAESHCGGKFCDSTGVQLHKDAVSAGNISTITFSIGLVALAGAAVLWFTAPQQPSASARSSSSSPSPSPSTWALR